MKAFADLYTTLDETTRTNEKVEALTQYFLGADPIDAVEIPPDPPLDVDELPEASEAAARAAWKAFLDDKLDDYDTARARHGCRCT